MPTLHSTPLDVSAQFGADAQALVAQMAQGADPLADALTAVLMTGPRSLAELLKQGIAQGHAAVPDAPPEMTALLRQAQTRPSWANAQQVQRGVDAYLGIGALWLGIALGPGSLAHTYSSPSVARVLIATANLKDRAMRRLQETANWQYHTMRPGSLEPGAPGYVHTLQVRLLHARVRANLLAQGWNVAERGLPINQLELMRTWLDFTAVPFHAMGKLGIEFTPEEYQDLYHAWHGVAHLLGIEERYYRRVHDQASGEAMLALIDAASGAPNADSALLTTHMLEAAGQRLAPLMQIPPEVAVGLMQGFCRLIHGDEMADRLAVPRTWWAALMPTFANANRYQRLLQRQDAQVHGSKVQATLGAFDQLIDLLKGETTYQRNLNPQAPVHALPVSLSEAEQA